MVYFTMLYIAADYPDEEKTLEDLKRVNQMM